MLNNTDHIFVNEMHWLAPQAFIETRDPRRKSIQSTRRGKLLLGERQISRPQQLFKKQVQQHICPSSPLYKVWLRSLWSPTSTLESREEPQSFDLKKERLISVVSCSIIQMTWRRDSGLWSVCYSWAKHQHLSTWYKEWGIERKTINRLQQTITQTLQTCWRSYINKLLLIHHSLSSEH